MLTSLFLSFLGGLGVFLIFLSLAAKRKPGGFERIARLTGETFEGGKSQSGPAETPIKTFRKHGLSAAITQADLPVSPAGFIRVGMLIGSKRLQIQRKPPLRAIRTLIILIIRPLSFFL